jgi:hypothetical protein
LQLTKTPTLLFLEICSEEEFHTTWYSDEMLQKWRQEGKKEPATQKGCLVKPNETLQADENRTLQVEIGAKDIMES